MMHCISKSGSATLSEAYTLTLGKPLIYTPPGMIDELNGNELLKYPRQS